MNILRSIFILILIVCATASANPVRDQHVSAELIAENKVIAPAVPFWMALKLDHDEHWHTYWVNDGDSGLPTTLKWDLPEGFTASSIHWPAPRRIPLEPLVSYGYEDEVWHLIEITPPPELSVDSVELTAHAKWLMCKEACIPGRATLTITLAVGNEPQIDPLLVESFADARARLPDHETDWTFSTRIEKDRIGLIAHPPEGSAELTDWEVFATEKGVVAASLTTDWEKSGDSYTAVLTRDYIEELPETLNLVMTSSPSMANAPELSAIEVSVPLVPSPEAGEMASAANSEPAAGNAQTGLLLITLSAFLGGMILNLMPCVFPVISLKILGFVNQAQSDPKSVWRHGLAFSAGVVISFWILAGILIALRAGGESIGWGFQLQSPSVLIVLSVLFFILALNLFGVFEMGLSLTSAGGSLASSHGISGSFFSGFLATVVATPCTAPFMGAALGYALTQPPYVSMVVFTGLAVGMAFPYLILSRFPSLLRKLPKPGAWMETMKQAMGFLLLATVLWLVWVLAALVDSGTLIALMAAFFLAGLGTWIMGRWAALGRRQSTRMIARVISLALIISSFFVGIKGVSRTDYSSAASHGNGWESFTPERLEELLFEGNHVFIDFTAKWCLTCQVNKLSVLRTQGIMDAFSDKEVTLLYADWTDENEIIAEELAKYGRQSVPLYLLFSADNPKEPVILPEILTKKIVRDALNKL